MPVIRYRTKKIFSRVQDVFAGGHPLQQISGYALGTPIGTDPYDFLMILLLKYERLIQ
jgi:hypothetical protein